MKQLKTLFVTTLLASVAYAQAQAPAVLGKLGQALKQSPIYAAPNTESRVYYTAEPYEYLVVQPAKEKGWMRVFMNNGLFAYVNKEAVAQLPYDIVTKPSEKKAVPVPERTTKRLRGSSTSRGKAAEEGLKYQGTKYVWGGNDLQNGIDCSGFVKQLFGQVGMSLPRTAAEQALVGKPIKRLEDLRKGDRLYFWEKKRNKIGHTGIYLGNGYFVHSSSGKGGVATDYLGSQKWLRILVAARR